MINVVLVADSGSASAQTLEWCQNGTMKRMNLRDVPDDVYAALVEAAAENRQSLNAFVVDRLTEMAEIARLAEYLESYPAPRGMGLTAQQAADAVQEGRADS